MLLVLDLLRHGAALPSSAGGEETRPLSPRGRADLARLAAHLAGRGWRPDRAFASPLRRARDSAVITLRPSAPDLAIELLDDLRPEAAPDGVLATLPAVGAHAGHVLLVGHQPMLDRLAGILTAGPGPDLVPGAMVRIEFEGGLAAGRGSRAWHLAPGFAP